ncbi:MAG: hypothetical protein M3N43_00945, partial [Actinomycetota bacterium]|nr:hypothetical protein [Actinomycetota bacterium]
MDELVQQIANGVTKGSYYALIALGYTMVYGIIQLINFAHGEVFMLGAFIGLWTFNLGASAFGWSGTSVAALVVVLLMAMLVTPVVGVSLERFAYRPLRHAPRLIPLISAIGVSFFLQDLIRLFESIWRNSFNLVYPTMDALNHRFELTSTIDVSVKSLVVIVASLLMLWALYVIVNRTKIGTAIRAVAEDQAAASLMGINVNRMISLTFLIGGAMGGAAGVLFGVQYSLVNPYTGFIPGLKAFTAAVLGGIGNIPGAMMGGLVLGLLEAFAASYLSLLTGGAFGAEYKDIFAFSILILILIFRPKGLLDVLPWVLVLLLALVAGMLASGLAAVAVERVAYRPLRHAPRLIPLISAIGVSFFLQDLIRLFESIWRNSFNLVYPTMDALNHRFELTPTIDVSVKSLVVIVASLLMLWALYVIVNRTKIGT